MNIDPLHLVALPQQLSRLNISAEQVRNLLTESESAFDDIISSRIDRSAYFYLSDIRKDLYTPKNYNEKTKAAHPTFYELIKRCGTLTHSCFFRRGLCCAGANEAFQQVINLFFKMFNNNDNTLKNMLIAGVGQSQEPFSYLAVIKEIIGEKRLEDVLELNTIDLQAKPPKDILFEHAFLLENEEPAFAKSSFIQDKFVKGLWTIIRGYRLNNNIFNYLSHTYNNKQKALWGTRLQDEIVSYPTEIFDVVSVNNVVGYINDDEEYYKTLKNLHRIIKPNGYIITDFEFLDEYATANDRNDFKQIGYGIFQKVK